MSIKVNQPLPFPTIVDAEDVASVQRARAKKPAKQTPGLAATARRPTPQKLPQINPVLLAMLEMEEEDLKVLRSIVADKTTYEITELYSLIEKLSAKDDSLEIKQGLKALEEQVRLREYLHVNRTTIVGN